MMRIKLFVSLILVSTFVGCSRGPKALKAPKIVPAQSAAQAIATYDLDGNGELSKTELKACPGIEVSIAAYDADGNGTVSQDEIQGRLEKLTQFKSALTRLQAIVSYNGTPLEGATVKLIPEEYLGKQVKPASGVTGPGGSAGLAIAKEDLPPEQQKYRGVHYGTFRVEITHPEKSLPAKYNTETTLGYETQRGNPLVEFKL